MSGVSGGDVMFAMSGAGATVLAAALGCIGVMWTRRNNKNPNNLHDLWPLIEGKLDAILHQTERQADAAERSERELKESQGKMIRVLDRLVMITEGCPGRGQGQRQLDTDS